MSGGPAPDVAVPLRAGPLHLVLDRGELRWIRLGEREILRGIYAAVREPGWATVPGRIEALVVEAEPDSFRARFVSRHRRGRVAFDWEGRVEGAADGRIVFEMDGVARAGFPRNRIGVCVLHPCAECAGRACVVETTDGARVPAAFPRLVAPQQPFLDVRAIRHEVADGVFAEVRLEGETFETEDQRNWGDSSFKTYSTPLDRAFPVEVAAGARVRQTVTLELHGRDHDPVPAGAMAAPGILPPARNSTQPVIVEVDPARILARPAVGLGGAEAPLGEREAAEIRRLRLAHVRADLHLESDGWEVLLERAVENARRAESPLELVVFLPSDPSAPLRALGTRAAGLGARVASWLVLRADTATTADGDSSLARAALGEVDPAALYVGGTDGHLVELNRRRPSAAGLDRLSFSFTPQVHAFDDATLVENLSSVAGMAETVRSFGGGAAVGISPVTLRPRAVPAPLPASPAGEAPSTDDPRQGAPFAAAWTLGLLAAAADARVASVTFFELAGPRGVTDEDGPFPVVETIAAVTERPEAAFLAVRSRRPDRVQALALRSGRLTRLFLANATRWRHPVRVEGLAGRARRAALGETGPGEQSGLELELGPHELVRLDVEEPS